MNFFKKLFGDTAQAEYERSEAERKHTAKLLSEASYHRIMANFYTERAASLNPHTQWWEFADAKQKEYDHQIECALLERRAGVDDLVDAADTDPE